VCGATVTVVDAPPVSVLVQTRAGWAALCRLLTDARHSTEKGRAETTIDRLLVQTEGLFVVLHHGWTAARSERIRDGFAGRCVVAVTRRLAPGDKQRVADARALAEGLHVPLIATTQPLMHDASKQPVTDVLTCIRRRTTLEKAGRSLMANASRVVLPHAEYDDRFADLADAQRAAVVLAESCTFSLGDLAYEYPHEVVPEGRTPMSWLVELTDDGLVERYPEGVPQSVRTQVAYELELIEALDFPAYFLTVSDVVRFARSRGILCQGRGSAANSAVCYALGVTSVDPSRASLLFERFISRERGEPPDIDIDFEHERREEVLQYVYERYGRDRAALVNEVVKYRLRSAIRDVGKVMGLSLDQVGRLAKSTDRWSAGPDTPLDDLVREGGLDPGDHAVRLTLDVAAELRHFPRHLSIHVGGFVITETPLVELCPVEPASMKDRTVIQWDKDDISVLKFVKVDLLSLGILTAVRKAFGLIEQVTGAVYTLATVPAEDPAVYDMFCRADTIGVFQIESRAQMSMLPRLKPRCFYDLVIEVSIVRPGPIQGGMVHPYLARRNGDEPIHYAHPSLVPVLERTLGVPLFQEQVMEMAVVAGGFSRGQADQLRRSMGAWRKRGRLDELGQKLVEGMVEQGIDRAYADSIFKQILGFGEYGFPESHAASFALIVYVSGWIKCHHPAAFAAALINSQPMGFYSPRAIVADAQRHGVPVLPVSVAESDWDCTLISDPPDNPPLRLGMRLVKGLREDAGRAVMTARESGPFLSLANFARRTRLDRGSLEKLAHADAFHALGIERRKALWELQGLWTGLPLFAGLSRREPDPKIPEEEPYQALQADYRSIGLSVDKHPLSFFRDGLRERKAVEIGTLNRLPSGRRVRIGGLVSNRQKPGTANGVTFMTLEDETGMVNAIIWPKVWAEHRKLARNTSLLGVDGTLQRQGDALSVLVQTFWALEETPSLTVPSRDFR
jgi:error-prone DNA polymerase